MKTKLVQIGNSCGVKIPKPLLNKSGLGNKVGLLEKKGEIKIVPAPVKKIDSAKDTLLMSEKSLGADWNKPEEDKEWESLQ